MTVNKFKPVYKTLRDYNYYNTNVNETAAKANYKKIFSQERKITI